MKTGEKPSKETMKEWHNDPANWRWGVFYYNQMDRRLFPPKRYRGFGWTVNFANPFSILVVLAIIILIFIIGKYLQL